MSQFYIAMLSKLINFAEVTKSLFLPKVEGWCEILWLSDSSNFSI